MHPLEKELYVYLCTVILLFSLDMYVRPGHYLNCKPRSETFLILFVHHIIASYYLVGWLSSNRYVLCGVLLSQLVIGFHWYMNRGNCVFTQQLNERCGFHQDDKFNDILKMIGIKGNPKFEKPFWGVILCIDMYVAYKIYRSYVK